MKFKEVELALENCIHGDYKFLYVSPERLESQHFQDYFVQMNINLIAVDEAHCISQWGYDFRPPYLRIAKLREVFLKVPILALTASATDEVRNDICEKLELKNVTIFAKSFARQNISYVVRHTDNKNQLMLDVLKNVAGTNIVYVRNRRKTQEVAAFLNSKGIRADYYHAGLDQKSRQDKQNAWMNDNIRTIVATNAFGMGINKPNVRSVIHIDLPDDLPSLPLELSYWVAGNLYGVAAEQQALLEMQNTGDRLRRESEILTSTRNHLAARTALKDVLN
jgi:ATP-dependent DNA helicase RecQ